MLKIYEAILPIVLFFFVASAASAVTFSVIGTSTSQGNALNSLVPGEEVTIDIRVTADGDSIAALGASVYGYDESVADFTSGEAVREIFHPIAVPGVGAFGGLWNIATVNGEGLLVESALGANGNRVQIFNSYSLSEYSDQPLDPGLDGVIGGGDAQFRLVFAVVGPGATSLLIGTGYEGDAVVLPGGGQIQANGAVVHLSTGGPPVPEPGTALLFGIGLAGLAAQGRRGRASAFG